MNETVHWKCLVCERTRHPSTLRSRQWIGICASCDDSVNYVVVRALKLKKVVIDTSSISKLIREHYRKEATKTTPNHPDQEIDE